MITLPPGAAEMVLSEPQNGATVNVTSGQRLEVRLASRPATGYSWEIVAGPPAVAVMRQSYDPQGLHIGSARMGPPGEQVFDIQVLGRAGKTFPLTLAYRKPQQKLALVKVYRVRIRVGPPAPTASESRPPR